MPPASVPGREIVQVLTEIPAGVESGWHTHPGEEVGYIVAGTVEMAVEGRPTVLLRPGAGFLIPPRTPHNARDVGPGAGRMLSTYVVSSAGRCPPPSPVRRGHGRAAADAPEVAPHRGTR